MHLAIRTALVSPDFLYRENQPGRLDDFGLASRLSYFLTSGPPDSRLRELAAAGKLSDPTVLEAETRRLLKDRLIQVFVSNFTGQWLGTRRLEEIMPDPKLLDFQPPAAAPSTMQVLPRSSWVAGESRVHGLHAPDFPSDGSGVQRRQRHASQSRRPRAVAPSGGGSQLASDQLPRIC